jgi:hypothetical protein
VGRTPKHGTTAPFDLNDDVDRSAPPPPRGARRLALLGVAVLGLASAAFVVRRPLLMSAPACLAGRWHGCWDTFNGVVLMTLVALPGAALVGWAVARRRRAAGVPFAGRTSLAEVGMVYGTLPFVCCSTPRAPWPPPWRRAAGGVPADGIRLVS